MKFLNNDNFDAVNLSNNFNVLIHAQLTIPTDTRVIHQDLIRPEINKKEELRSRELLKLQLSFRPQATLNTTCTNLEYFILY